MRTRSHTNPIDFDLMYVASETVSILIHYLTDGEAIKALVKMYSISRHRARRATETTPFPLAHQFVGRKV